MSGDKFNKKKVGKGRKRCTTSTDDRRTKPYVSEIKEFHAHPSEIRAVGSLVVRASDSRPEGLGSMLDVTKYPPSAHGFTCRNCGGGDRGRVAIYRPFGEVSLSLNRTVTCMVLKANDRRTSCPCHDEFRGPRSDYVKQVALATTTTTLDCFGFILLILLYLNMP
ncbi:uncharacterized protein TNCV_406431 [Trichonephila clavipes]|nr:uncharacterized protein TNCV_406431 [Trichonephila clavipes]